MANNSNITINSSLCSNQMGVLAQSVQPAYFQFHPVSTSPLVIQMHGQEIVRLNADGTVKWANDEMNIEAAAQAFSQSLMRSAEMSAGITLAVKRRMRDQVFDEIIEIAKKEGALDANKLTLIYEASKIIEKLKGE